MSDILNECPRCETLETERQMLDWVHGGVDIVYSCPACGIDFVTSLRNPIKEVVYEYEDAEQ